MKSKSWRQAGNIFILAVVVASIILTAAGCVSGLTAIGWSGGTISNGSLYVGSNGKLIAVDIDSNQVTESKYTLKQVSQTGLFGCSSSSAGGCGSGSLGVAVYGSPVIYNDLVIIAGYTGKVVAYSAENITSDIVWEYPRGSEYLPNIVSGLVESQGKIYFGCSDGKFEGEKIKGSIFVLDLGNANYRRGYNLCRFFR